MALPYALDKFFSGGYPKATYAKVAYVLFGIFVTIPLSVTALVFSSETYECGNIGFSLTVQDWLAGQGIFNVCLFILICGMTALESHTVKNLESFTVKQSTLKYIFKGFQCLSTACYISWIIVGAVLLFYHNITCIPVQMQMKFAVGYWAFTLLKFLLGLGVWIWHHVTIHTKTAVSV
jgi:hypothetical protein